MVSKKKQKTIELLRKYREVSDQIRELYAQRDALEDAILRRAGVSEILQYSPEEVVKIIDNFDGKNLTYGHGPVRRFEIVFQDKAKLAKASARAAKKATKAAEEAV